MWERQDKFDASDAGAGAFAGRLDEAGGFGVVWPSDRPSHLVSLSATGTVGAGMDFDNRVTALDVSNGNITTAEVADPGDGAVIVRRNAGLGPLWTNELGGGLTDVSAVDGTESGEVYAAGGHDTLRGQFSEGWLVKLDNAGVELWRRDAGSLGADAYTVVAAANGDALVAGRSSGQPWMARVSADGDVLWEHLISGDGVLLSGAVGEAPDGSFFVGCGVAETGGVDGDNILAVALTP